AEAAAKRSPPSRAPAAGRSPRPASQRRRQLLPSAACRWQRFEVGRGISIVFPCASPRGVLDDPALHAAENQPTPLSRPTPVVYGRYRLDDSSSAAPRAGTGFRACTFSLASCISPLQSASLLPPVSISGSKAASGFSAPRATELAIRAASGPTAGCTCGALKLPSTTIGPRRARRLGRFDSALSVRS